MLENAGGDVIATLAPSTRVVGASNGTAADLAGYQSATVVFSCGTLTDGTHTPTVEESDDNSSFSTATALVGTLAALTANTAQMVGYIGGKRYVRAVITRAGGATGAVTSGVIVRQRKIGG